MIPTAFAALVLASGLWFRKLEAIRLLMFWGVFGGSAAVLLPALGGASLAPSVAFMPFVLWAALRGGGVAQWLRQFADGEPGFWLLLLVLWAVVGAMFLPRLFNGEVDVLTTDRLALGKGPGIVLAPLRPVSTNLSQAAYAVGACLCFASARVLLGMPSGYREFGRGLIWVSVANLVAAFINAGELYLGLPKMLEFVRNAGYAILNQGAVGGLQRIHGTFPETSSFATYTLPLFAALLSGWRSGWQPRLTGSLALLSFTFLAISTSTTAYVGLALYFAWLGLCMIGRFLTGRASRRATSLVAILALAVSGLCLLLILKPGIATAVSSYLDTTLFGKVNSDSGMERGSWNSQAWLNFVDTHGVGVGLGSARASSYVLVLLSNVGAVGVILFVFFIASLYAGRSLPTAKENLEIHALVMGAREAVVAALMAAAVSATIFDLGLSFYALAAAAAGLAPARRRHLQGLQAAPGTT